MATTSTDAGSARPYACITCTQRKVKCDKCHPCAACSRSRLPCRYSNTPPSRQRRKRKIAYEQTDGFTEVLIERLRAHETALLNAGVPFHSFDESHDAAMKNDSGTGSNVSTVAMPNTRNQRDDSVRVPLKQQDAQFLVTDPGLPDAVQSFQPQIDFTSRPTLVEEQQQQQYSRSHRGVLLSEDGGKRYYEHGFIGIMGQEYRQHPISSTDNENTSQGDAHPWSSQNVGSNIIAEAILTSGVSNAQIGPRPSNQPHLNTYISGPLTRYWSIFLDNVHPLTKVIHAPSMEPLMLSNNAGEIIENKSLIERATGDALKYSVCACAISSLAHRECERAFGESQPALLYAFQSATRHVLSEASFLRVPDVDLLCAHTLLLTSMFHNSDRYSLWTIMGSTLRMAQSQGLHRDGSSLGLSPFKVEMRRRLWWYIVSLDQRLSELIGAESCIPQSTDTMLPCNCNDDDLRPDMTEVPNRRLGATEMTFCQAKYEIVRYLYDQGSMASSDRKNSDGKGNATGNTSQKKSLMDLKSSLEEKFLRFCDPVVPVQFLTTMVTRSTICKLMQMALHRIARPLDIRPPANAASSAPTSTQGQATAVTNEPFQLAARNLEYDNLIHSNKSLHGFLWHVRFFIPWGAPVYVLKSLSSRGDWDQPMQSAWSGIEELYEHHMEYIESDTDIHLLVGELTLQAWAARQAFLKSASTPGTNDKQPSTLPQIIPILQHKHRNRRHEQQNCQQQGVNKIANFPNDVSYIGDFGSFDPLLGCLPDFVDPLFVTGEWVNWAS